MTATEILSTDESDLELVRSASSQESSKKKSSKRKKKDSKKLSSSSKNKQARLSVPGASFSKWDKKTSKPLHDAPWPSRGLQHVYGPGASTLDKICTSSFTTRVPNHPADALPGPSTALQHFAHSTSFEQPSSNAESSNNKRPDIQNTDALTSRLLADIPSSDLPPFSPISTHFSSLYAPSKAEQVLGSTSRESATFLRDWLEELQLRPASDTCASKILSLQHAMRLS